MDFGGQGVFASGLAQRFRDGVAAAEPSYAFWGGGGASWGFDVASFDLSGAIPWTTTLPTAFAAIAGSVAVGAVLVSTTLLRRLRRLDQERRRLAAKLDADRSEERVFFATRDGLAPASAATEAELRRLLRADGAPFSKRFETAGDAGRGAAHLPTADVAGGAVGGPLLRKMFGEDAARALAHRILDLVRDGAAFEHRGRDARGRPCRFVGETVGAEAIVRMLPDGGGGDPGLEPRRAAAPQLTVLAAALDGAPSGVVLFTAEKRMMSANAEARRLLGIRSDWVSTGPSLRGLLDRLRDSGRAPERSDPSDWRATLLSDPVAGFNAEPLWALPTQEALRLSACRLAGGGFALFVSDESDAVALERRYRRALEASQATVSSIDQGLMVVGPNGTVHMVNAALASLWDLDPSYADPAERRTVEISQLARRAARDETDRKIWLDVMAALAGDGPRRAHDIVGRRSDGVRLAMRLTPLPDGSSLIAMRDMTEVDVANAALRERGDALEAVDRLKTAFVNDLAHELRSPLNTVIGFAEFLEQGAAGALNARQAEYVSCVLKGAGALRELVSDALDLGALESGAMALERTPTPVGALVEAAATAMSTRADARRAALAAPRPGPAAHLVVRADPERLRAAIAAIASVVAGQASVGDALSFEVEPAQVGRVRLAARLDRIEPMRSPPGRAEALGVAASLAVRMVEAHGGVASFASDAEGAVALVELPILIAEQRAAIANDQDALEQTGQEPAGQAEFQRERARQARSVQERANPERATPERARRGDRAPQGRPMRAPSAGAHYSATLEDLANALVQSGGAQSDGPSTSDGVAAADRGR